MMTTGMKRPYDIVSSNNQQPSIDDDAFIFNESLAQIPMCVDNQRHSTYLENQQSLFEQYNSAWSYLQMCLTNPNDPNIVNATQSVYDCLLALRNEWIAQQRRASLIVSPYEIDSFGLKDKFQALMAFLVNYKFSQEWLNTVIQESIIIEWPKKLVETCGIEKKEINVDCAPLLHPSKTNVNVRKDHPSMRIRILALNGNSTKIPSTAIVTAKLVYFDNSNQRHDAGALFQAQRQGVKGVASGTKSAENDAFLAKYYRRDGLNERISMSDGQCGGNAEPFKFDDNALCVEFADIAVAVGNKDEKRRSRQQRYFVEIYCELTFDHGQTIKKTIYTHPFLIAVNQEQNDQVIGEIIWEILTNKRMVNNVMMTEFVTWSLLREVIRNFVRSRHPDARQLDDDELLHIQCMLFLPLALREKPHYGNDLSHFEVDLFGNIVENIDKVGIKKIKYRLLRHFVRGNYVITKEAFMQQKCVSIRDCESTLDHSVWQWLFKATENIIDRNPAKLMCPMIEAAGTKNQNKSSMMCKLFNDRIITMSGEERLWKVFKTIYLHDLKNNSLTKSMAIRFCEENAGNLAFMYSNQESPERKPHHGTLAATTIKALKFGLLEVLFESPMAKKYDRIIHYQSQSVSATANLSSAVRNNSSSSNSMQYSVSSSSSIISDILDTASTQCNIRQCARITKKDKLFPNYHRKFVDANSSKSASSSKQQHKLEINPLTGEPVANQDDDTSPWMESITEEFNSINMNASTVNSVGSLM